MGIQVKQGGMLTTVQDGGRIGYQQFGMPQSGAVDFWALWAANLLLDNPRDEAALEVTVLGPKLHFTAANCIAITGADLSPTLNGTPCPMYRALSVQSGDVLTFGAARCGCRAYIAFAGGLALPPVMGSRATTLRAALGGFEGRALKAGDTLSFRAPKAVLPTMPLREMPAPHIPEEVTLRVVLGPQQEAFTSAGLHTFLSSHYRVGSQLDRMGCRLEGAPIEHIGDGNIISDGIAFGAIQVPQNGQPIIMLADRQTIGGYTKIATVITTDLALIAQCKGGETVQFEAVSVMDAQRLRLQKLAEIDALVQRFARPESATAETKELAVTVDGVAYQVVIAPGGASPS